MNKPKHNSTLENICIQKINEAGQFLCLLLCDELDVKWEVTPHQDCMQALHDHLSGFINSSWQDARSADYSHFTDHQKKLIEIYWKSTDLWANLIMSCPGHN